MLYDLYLNINSYFYNELKTLRYDDTVRAYITSILEKYKNTKFDYSNQSITLMYAEAKYKQDFFTFQNIGDWIFISASLFPEHLNGASKQYYISIGQISYYSCHKILKNQWRVFEQLADQFVPLTAETRKIIKPNP